MEVIRAHLTLELPEATRSLRFSAGERVALIGPSGCGKSTVARALIGESTQVRGEFIFRGSNLFSHRPFERSIGYLPQDLLLLPHLSVRQNLLFPNGATLDTDVHTALGISALLDRMPRHLSGGEKQRVALARALAGNPQLLVLDEPFASLDVATKGRALGFLDRYCQERALPFILISHDEREIKELNCNEVTFPTSV